MASEGFGGARVSGSGSQSFQSDCVSVFVGSNVHKCSRSMLSHKAPDSPRLLVAAQTLWDIAIHRVIQDPDELKRSIQSSQKSMKARKFAHTESPGHLSSPKPDTKYNNLSRTMGHPSPFKKPKLPMIENKEDYGHMNSLTRPSYWAGPRSSRSSPIRLPRDTVAESRNNNAKFARQSLIIPPLQWIVDKSNHSQQKVRKVIRTDL